MSDPHRIVDEIRACLQASDQSYKERHRDIASEYADVCIEVNRRLGQCAQLLKQGLRPEAIHLAEAAPNLLEALAELDFAERMAWLELVTIYNLPLPPDLDLETGEYLNVAYAEHDPLRNHLKKHRRLALGRAPLRERLAVLREIAKLDATNPIWDEDVRTYERARFKQVQAEATDAVRRSDVEAIEALAEELTGETWSLRPHGSLVQAVRQAAESERCRAAKRALPAVEAELNDAFSALDLGRARQVRLRWLSLAESARLSADDPARERAEPALLWLDDQDQREAGRRAYEAAEARLTSALDDDQIGREELERHWHALVRLEQEVPEHLAMRYRSRVAAQELSARRRMRFLLATGLTVALVLGLSVVLVSQALERGSAARAAAAAIEASVKSGRIDELEALIAQFSKTRPELLQRAEVVALMPEIDRLRAAETDRAERYQALMAEAESAPLTGSEPSSLAEARKLARTAVETRSLERLAHRIDRRNRDEAAQRDGEILPRLDTIAKALDALEADARNDPKLSPALTERFGSAVRDFSQVLPPEGPVSELARGRAVQVRGRLDAIRKELDLLGRRVQVADALTAAVGQLPTAVDGYVRAAEELAAAYDGTVQQADAKKVTVGPERDCWEPALMWARQTRRWADDPALLNPTSARERIAFCRGLLKDHPRSPDAEAIQQYLNYLEPIAKRDEPDGGLRGRLIQLLSSPSFDPLYMVRYKKHSGDIRGSLRYYSAVSPQRTSGNESFVFRYRVDADGNTNSQTLSGTLIVGDRGLSPQTKLVREIKSVLESGEALASWDDLMMKSAHKIAADLEMDPVCKLILLQAMLSTAAQGSLPLHDALEPTLKLLAKAEEFRSVKWLDPEANVEAQRVEASELIARLPAWGGVTAKNQAAETESRTAVFQSPRLVGWLTRRSPGWAVRFIDPKRAEGTLVVAMPDGNGGAWKPLGTTLNATDTLVPLSQELAAEARLVFARWVDDSAPTLPETRSAGR